MIDKLRLGWVYLWGILGVLILGFDAWVGHGNLSVPGVLTLGIVLAIDAVGLMLFSVIERWGH